MMLMSAEPAVVVDAPPPQSLARLRLQSLTDLLAYLILACVPRRRQLELENVS